MMRTAGLRAFAADPGTVMTSVGKAAIDDPTVRQWVPQLIEHLEKYRFVDPQPALERLGRQFVALASGRYDELSGRYLNLDIELSEQLAQVRRAKP